MALVPPCLLALPRFADVSGQRAVVAGVQVDIDGVIINRLVIEKYTAGHPAPVHDMAPVAVGIRTVGFELVDDRQESPPDHRAPLRSLMLLQENHSPKQPIGLDGTKWGIVPVEPLQDTGIGVDDYQRRLRLTGLRGLPGLPHVPLASALRPGILPVAGHHLVGTGHLVAVLREHRCK